MILKTIRRMQQNEPAHTEWCVNRQEIIWLNSNSLMTGVLLKTHAGNVQWTCSISKWKPDGMLKGFNLSWEWEAEVLHLCIYYFFVKQKRKLPQNQCTLDWRSVSEITNPQSVYIEGVTCHIKDIQSTLVKCVGRHWKFIIYDQARRFDILSLDKVKKKKKKHSISINLPPRKEQSYIVVCSVSVTLLTAKTRRNEVYITYTNNVKTFQEK